MRGRWAAVALVAALLGGCGNGDGSGGAVRPDTSGEDVASLPDVAGADVAPTPEDGAGGPLDLTPSGPDAAPDVASVADVAPDLAPADVAPDIAPDVTPDVYRGPIGGERPATVHLPADYHPGRTWPLLVLLHGHGVTGFVQDLYMGISRQVDALGFIEVVPDGRPDSDGAPAWNAVPACCQDLDVDDEAYLLGLIDEAAARWSIDPARVYLLGHSNGAFMAHRLACHAPERIAAIAALAGTMWVAPSQCAPSAPISVLQFHGTEDDAVPYGGAGWCPGAEETVARWAGHDGCPEPPTTGAPVDLDRDVDGAETLPTEWGPCEGGTAVALWRMEGSGHAPIFAGDAIRPVLEWLLARARP